jgi:hypothetical protein
MQWYLAGASNESGHIAPSAGLDVPIIGDTPWPAILDYLNLSLKPVKCIRIGR